MNSQKQLIINILKGLNFKKQNKMNKSQLKRLIKEEMKRIKEAPEGSDVRGSEAAKRAEWEARYGSMDGFDKAYPQFAASSDGMDDDMREFRSLLSEMDGHQSELEYSLRQISLEDSGLEMELEDALTSLETVITEIQESEGWI
jgi:hypothetical protein